MKSSSAIFACLLALIAWLMACGGTEGSAAPGFLDSALDTYEIEVVPSDFGPFSRLGDRPDERFVMVNMLVFKDMATGEGFEGLTGRQAYQIYAEGLNEAQIAIDSRFIWAASVHAQVAGSSDPPFQAMALLEYASPEAFLEFSTEPGERPEARSAGLRGQWLVQSTTLAEGEPASGPMQSSADELPDVGTLVRTTGLSAEQITKVLDGPADEPVFIIDLLRFKDGDRSSYAQYEAGMARAMEERGGRLVWRGSYDGFLLGAAEPSFDEQKVTEYPSRTAYLLTLSDPRVAAVSSFRADGLTVHWIYTAGETDIDLGF